MSLFGRRKAAAAVLDPATVVYDRCWHDPELDAAVDAVRDSGLPAPGRVEVALAHLAAVRDDPERQVQANETFGAALQAELNELRARGRSLREGAAAADLRALLAQALIAAAWTIRGRGHVETVAEDAWKPFRVLLEEADETGYEALVTVPEHAAAGVARLVTARGLGMPSDEWWHRFEVSRRARPTLYPAHVAMLQALCGKWYGSDELMWDFARSATEQAPPGDPVTVLLAMAHDEYFGSLQGDRPAEARRLWLASLAEGRQALREAADKWLGAARSPHPRDLEAHQMFGYLFTEAGETDRGRWHLERGSLRIAPGPPWTATDPGALFVRVLTKAGAHPSDRAS